MISRLRAAQAGPAGTTGRSAASAHVAVRGRPASAARPHLASGAATWAALA
jgi:hypothetical protein